MQLPYNHEPFQRKKKRIGRDTLNYIKRLPYHKKYPFFPLKQLNNTVYQD